MPVVWPHPYNPTPEQHLANVSRLLGVTLDPMPDLCDLRAVEERLKALGLPVFVVGYNDERRFLKTIWSRRPEDSSLQYREASAIVREALQPIADKMSGVDFVRCFVTDRSMLEVIDDYLDMTD